MRHGIRARIVIAALAAFAFTSSVQAEPMEEADYLRIDPPIGDGRGKIEIIEFFHYGCSACYRLEPLLAGWLASLPADVEFRRVPALRRQDWIPLTRLYFSLEALGMVERIHAQVYRDIHEQGMNLGNTSESLPWAARRGVDRDRLAALLDSDEVGAQVQRARDMTIAYGVRSTPSLAVDGRYLTNAAMLGDVNALLPMVDQLIDKARATRNRR